MSSIQGTIFDIREFCLHDGPGIRTTVFFKGCPLHCAWCHNPEGINPKPETLTTGRVCGRQIGASTLAAELRKQEPFFSAYGGGITFSGGEPLYQIDFLLACADALHPIHLALETSGFAPLKDYQRAVSAMDFILQDLKHPDSEAHRFWTGGDGAIIFSNLAWLKQSGTPFCARIPVIPTVNDTPEALEGFAKLLEHAPTLQHVELLPYQAMAGAKYALVGKTYTPSFDKKTQNHLDLAPFREKNIVVKDYTAM